MPVTATAKRALRSSTRKFEGNRISLSRLAMALHRAKKNPSKENVQKAVSFTDRAAKKKIIHKNKAARIKSQVSKFVRPSKKIKV